MIRANDVINNALYLIGVKAIGETVNADEAQICAEFLNNMLEEWATLDNINPKISVLDVLSDGNASYTVGSADPTNDFPTDMMEIDSVTVLSGSIVYTLTQISYEEYLSISVKDITAIPTYFAFNYQDPLATISLYPKATSGLTIRVKYKPRFTQVVNNQTVILMDPMWKQCLTYNLATRIAPMYPDMAKNLDNTIIYHAKASYSNMRKRVLKMNNTIARIGYHASGSANSAGQWYGSNFNNLGY